MKNRAIAAALAAAAALSLLAGCTKNNKTEYTTSGSTSTARPAATLPEQNEPPTEEEEVVIAASDGPKLSLSNTTAKPGEYADVILSVKDADMKWQMCGLHITYPNVLEPKRLDSGDGQVLFKRGEASDYSTASLCKEWTDNLPDELTQNSRGCFFFTEVFKGNTGQDGEIATFKLKIPDDAQSGTVYDLGFYYMSTDLFMSEERDADAKARQLYAFQNWQGGTITVE